MTGKHRSDVWKHFHRPPADTTSSDTGLTCRHCQQRIPSSTAKNATKLRHHLIARCLRIPPDERQSLITDTTDDIIDSHVTTAEDMSSDNSSKTRPKRKAAVKAEVIVSTADVDYEDIVGGDGNQDVDSTSAAVKCRQLESRLKSMTAVNRRLASRLSACLKQYEAVVGLNRHLEVSVGLMERLEAVNRSRSIRFDDGQDVVNELTDQLTASNGAADEWRRKWRSIAAQDVKRSAASSSTSKSTQRTVAVARQSTTPASRPESTIWQYFQRDDSSGYKVIKCIFCDKVFKKKTLNAFQSRLHIVESCDKCPKHVRDKENMWRQKSKVDIWRHFVVTGGGEEFRAQCRYCGHRYLHRNATKCRRHLVFQCKAVPALTRDEISGQCDPHFLANYSKTEAQALEDKLQALYPVSAGGVEGGGDGGSPAKRKVDIWCHFDVTDSKRPVCRYCGHQYMTKNATKCRHHLIALCKQIPEPTKEAIVRQLYGMGSAAQPKSDSEDATTQEMRDMGADDDDDTTGALADDSIDETLALAPTLAYDIWQHFSVSTGAQVCLYCGHTYADRKGNASKCRRHLLVHCQQIPIEVRDEIHSHSNDNFLIAGDIIDDSTRASALRSSRPKSRVWQHFAEEMDETTGQICRRCVYCEQRFVAGTARHATKMRYHLALQCQRIPDAVRQSLIGDNQVFARRANTLQARPKGCKSWECSWPGCDKAFPKQCQLLGHQKYHTGERIHCEWPGCEWTGRTRHNLTLHKYSHSGEKPFACDWPGCEFKSARPSSLKIHKMRHKNLLRYRCDWKDCERVFLTGSQLKVHKLAHSGDKPHACQLCDKRYPTLNKLKVHQNKQHPNPTPSA